jgi:hypothetical protein
VLSIPLAVVVVAAIGLLGMVLLTRLPGGSLIPSMLKEASIQYSSDKGKGSSTAAMNELAVVEKMTSARTTKLELPCCDQAFDPKGVYSDPQELDLDHPNRIDRYGSLFQDDEDEAEPGVWKSVKKLKNELIHLARMQQKFMERLDHPVQVSQTVMPGEPGRMGARGKRGVCVCLFICVC